MSVSITNVNTADLAQLNDQLPGEQTNAATETTALLQDDYANQLFAPGNGDEIRKSLGITANEMNKIDASLYLPDFGINNDLQEENILEDDIANLNREEMSNVSLAESPIFEDVKYRAEITDDRLRYKIGSELN